MTGYGRDILHMNNTTITVEIRSVNHRYLDFSAKIPNSILFLEDKLKEVIKTSFKRGRVEIHVKIAGDSFVEKQLKMDWDLMDQYMHHIKMAQKRYQLSSDIPATIIASMPELFSLQEIDVLSDELSESILICTKRACEQSYVVREQEGTFLIKELSDRMQRIRETVLLLGKRQGIVIDEYQQRIQTRIDNHLKDSITIDSARLHQEIALLAEKGDITEEITRLESHMEHFYKTIHIDEPIGRTIDFIVQEMHRETNTIGAKSLDTKISEWVVLLKGDIEKIREQIQNIE